jgi:3-hydroxyisobutyrate dehydrogenase-like beta-hydroxyacid dehydrogenase
MQIAVLGMGKMGQALAGRLVDGGHDLVIWNRTAGRAPDLVDAGAREATGIADAVGDVALAITSLANDEVVREVACGGDGIRSAGRDDLVYVDASTVSPALSAELTDAFPHFASMPILGSPALVASGDAVYLIGGAPDVVKTVDPLFDGLTGTVHRYDQPALAAAAKLAVNLLLLDGLVALAESFAVGRAGGLSDDQLRELLADNNMVAPGLKNRFEGLLTGEQAALWSPALGAKDAGLAVDLVAGAGGELRTTPVVQKAYGDAARSGSEDDDIAAVGRLYQR